MWRFLPFTATCHCTPPGRRHRGSQSGGCRAVIIAAGHGYESFGRAVMLMQGSNGAGVAFRQPRHKQAAIGGVYR
ncbi:hypothetical protein E2C01_085723 [Portunus trituberculatus]|uniref:Uncharacterized protein n=1 Tax=Portunus trituberculatus TaxID=210409 RepID=A0A5B7J9N3_PORTR|nr:hypothetical protein [Portunus trituberculatus]